MWTHLLWWPLAGGTPALLDLTRFCTRALFLCGNFQPRTTATDWY